MLFQTIKAGVRVLYSTPITPRTYGKLVSRARNRAFRLVESELGELETIHKSDIITVL